MSITLRRATADDAATAGRICYQAFTRINTDHGFAPDFPNVDAAVGLLTAMFGHPGHYAVVAECDGRLVGSNVLCEHGTIAGIGPITVDPDLQNGGVGRQLMRHVLERAAARGAAGVRLVQAAFHNRSLSLYTKLGFDAREPLACVQGPSLGITLPGHAVRPATAGDIEACNQVCLRVHGHAREGDLRDGLRQGTAVVVERDGRISGYASGIAFFGHAVGESNGDVQAMLAAAPAFGGPGVLVPTRNAALLRWCLEHGLRVTQPVTLMTIGLYNEPQGSYLSSISY
jgi:GNAT superfamily N-acetyltransferase